MNIKSVTIEVLSAVFMTALHSLIVYGAFNFGFFAWIGTEPMGWLGSVFIAVWIEYITFALTK